MAVWFEDETLSLSLGDLDRRSDRLARHLRRRGVGPEVRVGIFAERAPEVVVGLLAISKADGAYVPLDPDDPAARVELVLADADLALLLTQEALLPRLPDGVGEVVCLDRLDALPEVEDPEAGELAPTPETSPENLAYLLYTSGSTGRPKGAMNTLGGVRNRLEWMQAGYRLSPSDRVLQKTPLSFDVSGWELWLPLMSGATMVLARPGGHRDSAYLAELIRERGVTVAHFVPSMLRIFLEDPEAAACETLRQVICSGEELTADLQRRFFEVLPHAQLDNIYGPTEAAIDVSGWRCDPRSTDARVPIGRPISRRTLYVLDLDLEPVDDGQEGELYIGGVQVGRGYHRRPALTAERFLPDPFSATPGARMYRTGDLARRRPDGALEFLGRTDHQVKLRGVRIELGKVDAVAAACPGVRAAVTVAREFGPDDRRLVTYLVLADGEGDRVPEVERALAARLPEPMRPAAIVVLDGFPLTSSGKLDRAALPAPEARPTAPASAPGSPLEQYLAALWCEILRVDRVGLDDRFFELGGSSLLAARMVNRLQAELGENSFVVAMFEAPTVAQLAAFLTERYPEAIARKFPGQPEPATARTKHEGPLSDEDFAALRDLVPAHPPGTDDAAAPSERNPRAIFLLSTHRSGTTLLRAMLAGHPGMLQPVEFVRALRRLTAERDIALVFDEMVTGFRLLQGGAQEFYGVRADIATYGKVVGGGMPIGIVAGAARFLDALDGGDWRFGDDSVPEKGVTWFSGTFVRHPLALAAARAALEHMKREGPGLQIGLNRRAAAFRDEVNAGYAAGGFPIRLVGFGSLFQFRVDESCAYGSLYFHYLRDRNVHVHERRPHFLTTAHTDADLAELVEAFLSAAATMRADGFLPEATGDAGAAAEAIGEAPLTQPQQEIWVAARVDPDASRAFQLSTSLDLEGELDRPALRRALDALVRRHAALRATIDPGGETQRVAPRLELALRELDVADLDPPARDAALAEFHAADAAAPFDLGTGPLVRAALIRLGDRRQRLVLTAHHIVCDGWSMGILLRDLGALYAAERSGRAPTIPAVAPQFDAYARERASTTEPVATAA